MGRIATIAALSLALALPAARAGQQYAPNPLERILPASTLALVQAEDLGALADAYRDSALAEAVKSSRLLSYFATVGPAAVDFAAVALTGLPAEEARRVFGRRAALMVLGFRKPAEAGKRPLPLVVFVEVADPKKTEAVLKGQLELFGALAGQDLLTTRQHAGATVYQVSLPKGQRPSYCFLGSFLAIAQRETLKELLEALAAGGPRLADVAAYLAVREQTAAPAGISGYLNLRAVLQKKEAALGDNPEALRKHHQGIRALGLADAQALGAAVEFHGRRIRDRVYLHTGGAAQGFLKFLTEGRPVAPACRRFVPPGYTVLATLALRDVGLWDRMRQMLVDIQGEVGAGQMQFVAEEVRKKFAIDLKGGVFDAFVDEGFVAVDLSQIGRFLGQGREPTPQEFAFLVGGRLRDPGALTQTLDRIAANETLWEAGVERVSRKHRGVDVFTFRLPFKPKVRPTYAVVDNVFVFSIRPEAVVASVDASKSGKSFATRLAPERPEGVPALPKQASVRLDVNDAQLTATLLGLVRDELPEGPRRFLPQLDRILAGLSGYGAVLRREPQGCSLTAVSDLGTVGTALVAIASLDRFNLVVAKRVHGDFEQIAAAVERYRAKHKAYPESLEQLVPEFLPKVPRDRFKPAGTYRYSRGRPRPDGVFSDAWILTSVGPDKDADIPVEQFDPVEWPRLLQSADPDQISRLKALIYQFRKDDFGDERKNDDEGDLFRFGGRDVAPQAPGGPARPPADRPLRRTPAPF